MRISCMYEHRGNVILVHVFAYTRVHPYTLMYTHLHLATPHNVDQLETVNTLYSTIHAAVHTQILHDCASDVII